MLLTESQDSPPVVVTPTLLAGMMSPLWSYYAALTTAGLAFWGLSRLSQPVNLEAALEAVVSPPPAVEPLELAAAAPPERIDPPVETPVEAPVEAAAEAAPDISALDPVATPAEPSELVKAPKPSKASAALPAA